MSIASIVLIYFVLNKGYVYSKITKPIDLGKSQVYNLSSIPAINLWPRYLKRHSMMLLVFYCVERYAQSH